MVDPTRELQASVRRVELELGDLASERARLERERLEIDQKILKRVAYLKATSDLLKDLNPDSDSCESESRLKELDIDLLATSPSSTLSSIAKSGYGAATRGVIALLAASADGCTAREMIDAISKAGFDIQDPDTAVRSALKNLRRQQKVVHNETTRRYQLTPVGRKSLS